MKEIKILHLFPDLLSLYGEYGNVAILKKTLEAMGISVALTRWNGGDLELADYDFIYVGSGTEENLLEAIRRLLPCKEQVVDSIARNKLWLVTGNAMTIFAQSVQYRGETHPGLALLPHHTQMTDRRFLGDVLSADTFGAPLIGYVNTSCSHRDVSNPLLHFRLGNTLGSEKGTSADGIRWNEFYATQLIGPVLVKNPHFLCHVVKLLTGCSPAFAPESNICMAYQNARQELEKRL